MVVVTVLVKVKVVEPVTVVVVVTTFWKLIFAHIYNIVVLPLNAVNCGLGRAVPPTIPPAPPVCSPARLDWLIFILLFPTMEIATVAPAGTKLALNPKLYVTF